MAPLGEFPSQAFVILLIAVLASAVVPVYLGPPSISGIGAMAGIFVLPTLIIGVFGFALARAFSRKQVSWRHLGGIYGALAVVLVLLSVSYLYLPPFQTEFWTKIWLAAFLSVGNIFMASAVIAAVITAVAIARPKLVDELLFPFVVTAIGMLSLLVLPIVASI